MAEEKNESKAAFSISKGKALVGILTVLTSAGIGGYYYFQPEEPPPPPREDAVSPHDKDRLMDIVKAGIPHHFQHHGVAVNSINFL